MCRVIVMGACPHDDHAQFSNWGIFNQHIWGDYNQHSHSLDGRYFGPLPRAAVIGRATPLYTDAHGDGHFVWHGLFADRPRAFFPNIATETSHAADR